ncbi:MAG: RES family NAD+ phosphorylase [Bdellovibrionales bacterium]
MKFLRILLSAVLVLQFSVGSASQIVGPDLPDGIPYPSSDGDTLDISINQYKFNGRRVFVRTIVSCKAGEKRVCYRHQDQYLEPQVVVHSEFSVPSEDSGYSIITSITRVDGDEKPLSVKSKKRQEITSSDGQVVKVDHPIDMNDSVDWEKFGAAIASGIVGINDQYHKHKEAVERSKDLYNQHRDAIDHYSRAHASADAERQQALDKFRSDLILSSSNTGRQIDWNEAQQRLNELNKKREMAAQIQNDPLAQKTYELSPKAQQDSLSQLEQAIESYDFSELPALFEELAYQKSKPLPEVEEILAKYLDDGVLQIESLTGEAGPLDDLKFQSSVKKGHGQVLRRLANQLQAEYASTDNLNYSSKESVDFFGTSSLFLNLADTNYFSGNMEKGDAYLKAANSLLEGAIGFGQGVGEGLLSIVTDIPETIELIGSLGSFIVNNPAESYDKASQLVANLPELSSVAAIALQNYYEDFKNASPEEKGMILGGLSADLVASFATLGATRLISGTRAGASIIKMGSKARGLLKISHHGDQRLATNAMEVLDSLPNGNRSKIFKNIESTNGDYNYLIQREGLRLGTGSGGYNKSGIQYLDKVHSHSLSYENPSVYGELLTAHKSLDSKMASIDGAKYSGIVHRVIPEQVPTSSGTITNTVDNAFDFHPGVKPANGRYSMPGNEAIYGAIGDDPYQAYVTAFEEIDHYADGVMNTENLIIGSKKVELGKVLDLTDSKVLNTLGIDPLELVVEDGETMYKRTHQIGDLAKRHGFDAIVAPSARSEGTNIILLKEVQ